MKKLFTVLLVLSVGATTFASSGKFGLDFSWGLNMGFQNMSISQDGQTAKFKRTDLALPVVRVSSYNFFLLDDMLGVFASANISAGLQFGDTIVADGRKTKLAGAGIVGSLSDAFLGIEFMVGPSFGIDLNENLRFQTGLGFHYLFEKSFLEGMAEATSAGESVPSISLHSFGIGLTPQLRFSPAKKASFILGCDFIFDFGRGATSLVYSDYDNSIGEYEMHEIPADGIGSYFRFGFSPYLGVGINF